VKWLEQQVSKKRVKRDDAANMFNDPKWPTLWYLVSNSASRTMTISYLDPCYLLLQPWEPKAAANYAAESTIKLFSS